jgi:hypothetical protein
MNILRGRRIVAVNPGEDGSTWIQVVPEDKYKGSKWDSQWWCRHDCCRSEAILATVRDYAPRAPRKDNIDWNLAVDAQFWLMLKLSLDPATLHRWLVWWAQRWVNDGGGVPAGLSAMQSFWMARRLLVWGPDAN